MRLAKTGNIQNVCQPNAIMTFQEYLLDYASEDVKKAGEETIRQHLDQIKDEKVKKITEERLEEIRKGKRDLYL